MSKAPAVQLPTCLEGRETSIPRGSRSWNAGTDKVQRIYLDFCKGSPGPFSLGPGLFEVGEFAATNQETDGSRLAGKAFDEATLFEGEHHPMYGGWGNLEIVLQIGF